MARLQCRAMLLHIKGGSVSTASELLSEVPFFVLLDEEEKSALAADLDLVQFPKGQMIFQYGEPGDSLYIIRSGKAEIFVKDNTGNRLVLGVSGPGHFFGELSLLDQGPRTATVVAIEDIEVL